MCGIAGIYDRVPPGRDVLESMTDALAHRGPDAHGYFLEDRVGLGHRRLSVFDPLPRSNQPFYSHDKRFVVVFNGEIYNFKEVADSLSEQGVSLNTTSDTEVLIEAFALWGPGFIQRLNGMFAIAIYDTIAKKLYLYRDRVGKKPLYYYWDHEIFLFASEMKALFRHPRLGENPEVNRQAIPLFLQLGYIPGPGTFFSNVFKLPAGHYGILTSDLSFSLIPYWDAQAYVRPFPNSPMDPRKHLTDLVRDAVRIRLQADVPVGVFLSGGIDSSLITAEASLVQRPKTFSIGFREARFDESKYAEDVARFLKTDHHTYVLTEKEATGIIDHYIQHFDEPFADTSAIPTMLVSQLARKDVTVALTGDGGDELFMGYGAHTWADRLAHPAYRLARPVLRQLLARWPSSRAKRVAHMFDKLPAEDIQKHIFSQEQYLFSESELNRLLLDRNLVGSLDYQQPSFDWLSAGEKQAFFDFVFYLRDDLLVKIDRSSMQYGLECRSPLLDYRIVEFALSLPRRWKRRGHIMKYLLRERLFELVPERLFRRPKWGFSIPMGRWLRNDLRHLLQFVDEEHINRTGIFDPRSARDLINRFLRGEDYLYGRLWAMIVIQKYLLRYDRNR